MVLGLLRDIPEYSAFVKIEPINKGWSEDKKFYIETADGRRMFLRVSDIAEYDRKKADYMMTEQIYKHGVPTTQPFGFGVCGNGKNIYSLSGWIDGQGADIVLPLMSEAEQYALGVKAGEVLRKIHSIPVPETAEPWGVRYRRKVKTWVDEYNSTPQVHSDIGARIVRYLEKHSGITDSRPQTFIHGDYNIENIVVVPNGEISVIDLSSFNTSYGDPWWDMNNMAWMPVMFPCFYTGQIKGYFNGEPPPEFWNVSACYLAYDALAALTDPYGLNGIEDGTEIVNNILKWMDNFKNPVPSWYLKDFYAQWTDGVPYKLKAPFDFSFLGKYGKVFKVYDDQDSGNICFGVADGENKYFVKFAGAPTERSRVSAEEAVGRIKSTVPIYRDLAHPTLTRLINAEEIGGGFAMVFEWTDAECMGRQYPGSREKFMQMPLGTRRRVFDEISEFHAHAAKQGYVAVDFYDGCIMYDFNAGRTVLCDIEFYAKTPYNNPIGRMWGSSRFMSPEEFELGAAIDEITNVYTMGATAFALFGDERERCFEQWVLSKELFDAAKKAVSDDRGKRQQSIEQFIAEWRAAK